MKPLPLLSTALLTALLALTGCNACEKLEEKMCTDLGADCPLWKQAGGPEALYGGRRANRACMNMMTGPTYDAMLKGARAVVEAQKATKAPPTKKR